MDTRFFPISFYTNPASLSLGLRPDLAVDVETCMAPKENLLHQGEDLMGEYLIKV
jgi:hypothetical protein